MVAGSSPVQSAIFGPFVYRLGRWPFTPERGVRFPYGLPITVINIDMKKKEFIATKQKYLGALALRKAKKAAKLKMQLFQEILERKAEGKSLKRFNYH